MYVCIRPSFFKRNAPWQRPSCNLVYKCILTMFPASRPRCHGDGRAVATRSECPNRLVVSLSCPRRPWRPTNMLLPRHMLVGPIFYAFSRLTLFVYCCFLVVLVLFFVTFYVVPFFDSQPPRPGMDVRSVYVHTSFTCSTYYRPPPPLSLNKYTPLQYSCFHVCNLTGISCFAENDKDTPADVVRTKTYVPVLSTFEQDIMQKQGIVEERTYKPSYWY